MGPTAATPYPLPVVAPGNPFDKSHEYEAMLARGLRLSGEDRAFFMEGRVRDLREQLPTGFAPRRVLDLGCGTGETSAHLACVFPRAEVLGIDTAEAALDHAREAHESERVRFARVRDFDAEGRYDLCYTNGVFHHIAPVERLGVVRMVHRALTPSGRFALMENNPWNPGARWVMARIEFDRDSIPLAAPETRRLLREGGFADTAPARFLFVFPRALRFLRFLEPWLTRLPLGAQYYVLAAKEAA